MTVIEQVVLDAASIDRAVRRISSEIMEVLQGPQHLRLVGIQRGGVPLAHRLAREIARVEGTLVPVGTVDIGFYRDDAAVAQPKPHIGPSDVPFEVEGMQVVLVDDVLQTGRTVRAALDCLLDYGRPGRVWLAVLCDRGGRELPVAAEFVGKQLEVPEGHRLQVALPDQGAAVTLRGPGA